METSVHPLRPWVKGYRPVWRVAPGSDGSGGVAAKYSEERSGETSWGAQADTSERYAAGLTPYAFLNAVLRLNGLP